MTPEVADAVGRSGVDEGVCTVFVRHATAAVELPNTTEEGPRRRFLVRPSDYRLAEQRAAELGGELLGFYHSHPDHPARPSQFDLDHAWPSLKRYAEFDSYKYHGNRDKYMKDAWRRLALRKKKWDGVHVTDDELDSGAELALAVLADMLQDASLTPQELWVSDASVA